jgi:exopolysaccharide biosynthesis polyprenyl glycosylphosphotransferase
MNKRLQIFKYLTFDYLTAIISWTLFYIFRKVYIEPLKFGIDIPLKFNERYFLGLLLIPIAWLSLYYLTGFYRDIYRKSRLNDVLQTFIQSVLGVILIFFFLLLDDEIKTYKNYYLLVSVLFTFHFSLTLVPRLILTSISVSKIKKGIYGFKTLIIGSNKLAVETYKELIEQEQSYGNKFVGYVNIYSQENYQMSKYLPHLGSVKNLVKIINDAKIEEVIIAMESPKDEESNKIINKLCYCNVVIKVIPNMYNILTGQVKMTQLFGTPLIQLSHDLMPVWQENLKQIIDFTVAFLALLISLPLSIFICIGIKISSPGPIFYSHERIGRYGKPFQIYKFRSMTLDAEANGPELSSKNDSRLTNFGKFMRKYRMDEIPNFLNVLFGEMSLVGPRPERKFYIDQIIKKAPHYVHLQKVKPGITSWGQVKYGYAENIDQMIKRLRYDIIYIENMSLYVDMKIIFYTIYTIFKGRGV